MDLGLTVLQKQLDKLPVINPLYLSDYYINHEKDNIPLGLSISNYIISLIGPYKYIKIIEKENHKMVQFKIY